jgi:glycosyltransferase involved in cell wall biosynthesis
VIHRTQYPLIDLTPAGFRKVSTLHDMWTERHGRSRGDAIRSHFKRSAIDRSDVVVCVSEYTRQSVLEVWPDMSDRLTVIHHGADPVSGTPVDPGYPWPYLLYVGQRELRKNFPILLQGLAHAHGLRDVRLVCAGGEPLTGDELAMIDQLGLTGRVVQRQANDHELAGLYEGAEALLYPSRYEGFGMPLLEAMLHGCLVVCSPLTCLPEIGGDAVVYVDAESAEGWAEAMQDAIANGTRMQELREKALARASTFSWKSAARKYKEIYESLR